MPDIRSVTVFANCGPTGHQAQYRQAGSTIARRGARLICVSQNGDWPRALVDSALAAGGRVTVVTSSAELPLRVPQGVQVEAAETERAAAAKAVSLGDAIIALPSGIAVTAMLYAAWTDNGGRQSGKPVGLLNFNRAFEVVRGFMADIATPGLGSTDGFFQTAENFEELWNRLARRG